MPKAPYDPQKQHEYYERTKQLKGRKKGAGQPDHPKSRASAQQIQNAQQKVAEIRGKLDRLRALLREKTAASHKTAKPDEKNHAQKEADKKASREYYDKHKQAIKGDKKKGGGGGGPKTAADMSADELRTAIRNVATKLKAAIADAQRLKGGG